jgi:hypothetical protein
VQSRAAHIETLIRKGNIPTARKELRQINIKKIPRPELKTFANLAYRVDMPWYCLKLLKNTIYREDQLRTGLVEEEILEYVAGLMALGALREAERLLSSIKNPKSVKHSLYWAYLHISRWDYNLAIPWLLSYLDHPGLTDYQFIVGELNLVSCLNYESQQVEFNKRMQVLIKKTKVDYPLIFAHALEIKAQNRLSKGKFDECERLLETNKKVSSGFKNVNELFIQKLEFYLDLKRHGYSRSFEGKIKKIIEKAISLNQGESIRDLDYHICLAKGDFGLYTHLYFGTPFKNYRKKMVQRLGFTKELPSHYEFGAGVKKRIRIFDLKFAKETDLAKSKHELKGGQLLHQLLGVLCSDFYRPIRVAGIFLELFPGEHFDVDTSPDRVYKLVARLRNWLAHNKVPVEVGEIQGAYHLKFNGPYAFRKYKEESVPKGNEARLLVLREHFKDRVFSAKEARVVLGVSPRQCNYVIQAGTGTHLIKTGAGPSTRFQFL